MAESDKNNPAKSSQDLSEARHTVMSLKTALVEMRLEREAAKKSEKFFHALLNAMEDLVFVVGMDGTFSRFYQDPGRKDLFAPPKSFLGKNFRDVLPTSTAELFQKAINAADTYGMTQEFDYQILINKKARWYNAQISPFRPASGEYFGYLCVLRDITDRILREEVLKGNEEKYRTLIQQSTECIILVDVDKRVIIEANQSSQRLLGYSPDDLRGMSLADLMPEKEEDKYAQTLRILEERGYYKGERIYCRKDGSQVDVEISIKTITSRSNKIYCVIFRDITPRKLAERQLTYTATHDPLTGLVNRLLFYERLGHGLAVAGRNDNMFALLYIDLDKFKEINDTHGHGIGDQILRAVGLRLNSVKRRKSDSLARMGGDEYTFILSEISNAHDAEQIAKNLVEILREPFELGGLKHRLSASIGIAVYPIDASDAESLIKAADIAMYYAKNEGRDCYKRYSPDMRIH